MRHALVALRQTPTNGSLTRAVVDGGRWELMSPEEALAELRPGDAALGRLDVLPTLDGIDDGVWALGALEASGVVVLNHASALYATHDKLLTARLLRRAGVPHPRTAHVRPDRPFAAIRPPVVVKPRFGSGGEGVTWCADESSLSRRSHASPICRGSSSRASSSRKRSRRRATTCAFSSPPSIVGAIFRVAADGEWRTNIALGGARRPVADPPRQACELALIAARAAGTALVGVDLVPDRLGTWTVIELNGAVEFTEEYLPAGDVFADVAGELMRAATAGLVPVEPASSAA